MYYLTPQTGKGDNLSVRPDIDGPEGIYVDETGEDQLFAWATGEHRPEGWPARTVAYKYDWETGKYKSVVPAYWRVWWFNGTVEENQQERLWPPSRELHLNSKGQELTDR